MSSFEEREKAHEAKFAHDAELRFKAEARRNKHLANWASDQLGVTGTDDRINYVAEIIAADMSESGTEDVVRKIKADFDAAGVATSEETIRTQISVFDAQAREEVLAQS